MDSYTKESPGCYHSMIKFLAELEGTEYIKTIVVKEHRDLYTKTMRKKLLYPSSDIKVISESGMQHSFIVDQIRYDHPKRAIVPDHFEITMWKNLNDFRNKPVSAGNYKDSLGGGWYSTVPMYRFGNKYFAGMECTCR